MAVATQNNVLAEKHGRCLEMSRVCEAHHEVIKQVTACCKDMSHEYLEQA
jgi:hypothetical protein